MMATADLDIAANTVSQGAPADPQLVRLPVPVVRAIALLRAIPDGMLLSGALLIVAGFGLVAYGWGKVASLHVVGLQMPYLASTAFPGAGLVICGVAITLVSSRNKDAAVRRDQLRALTTTLDQVASALENHTSALSALTPPSALPAPPSASEITDQLAAVVALDSVGSTRVPRRRR